MLAPRDQSDQDRKSQMRDGALYGMLVGAVVFVLLVIVMPGWIAPFVFAVLATALAMMFFLWSATEGFTRFSDGAADRIAQHRARGSKGRSSHLGAGDPGGVDTAVPDPEGEPGGESAREAAKAFQDAGPSDAGDRDHSGAGDPGGIDPGMPTAESGDGAGSARESAEVLLDGAEGRHGEADAETLSSADVGTPERGDEEPSDAIEGTKPDLLDAPRQGSGDDLKAIRGIGPKLEAMLQDLGVWHYSQIASWGPAEVTWVDRHLEGFKGRIERDDWVSQAETLSAGDQTEFSERVDRGDVY